MIKKEIILTFLICLLGNANLKASEEVAVEMTWPLSALLWVCEGNYTTIQNNTSASWGKKYYFGNNNYGQGALPQVNGYYATKAPFSIVLQQGTNMQNGFLHPGNSPFANYIHYFSDVVRAFRNPYVPVAGHKREFSLVQTCETICKRGPGSSVDRGMSSTGWGVTYDDALALITTIDWSGDGNEPLQIMKWCALGGNTNGSAGQIGLKGIYLTAAMFTPVNGKANSYYFTQTGADIYLPLHMISPGDYLLAADDDYVNFGPGGPNDYNGTYSQWLSWYNGYIPKNIPYNLIKGTSLPQQYLKNPTETLTAEGVSGETLHIARF